MPHAPMRCLRRMAALPLLLALGAQAAPAGHHTDHGARPRPPHPAHRMARDAAAGTQFSMAQHHAAMAYFAEPGHQGFVPPGLAKKGGLPPGQLRQWQRGQVLPAGVVFFALPRSLELVLGPPPAGHRYVRVATDILLLAIGTGIVVDALEDLVR
ncbi:MAG: hypothetical protein ACKOFG_15965 [Limnohabitans sp.]